MPAWFSKLDCDGVFELLTLLYYSIIETPLNQGCLKQLNLKIFVNVWRKERERDRGILAHSLLPVKYKQYTYYFGVSSVVLKVLTRYS